MYIFWAKYVHMAEVTLTELRKHLFRLADQAIETGEPVVVRRKGRKLTLRAETDVSALSPAERWARFKQLPSPAGRSPAIDEEAADHWRWSEEPDLEP
jgi:antitoxin (DNA-binding transcriptional repressor) of toxin-antitoxin stability system